MKLDDTQKQKVTAWINDGAKLSEIQKRLGSEFGQTVTYMEVRMLVDDLRLVPKDPEPPAPVAPPPAPVPHPAAAPAATQPAPLAVPVHELPENAGAPAGAQVKVTVDAVTKPGTLVSGGVTFSDGVTGQWYLDQTGRLGVTSQPGYKPGAADVQAFQLALDQELRRQGL